jgi:hypothetical protein
MTSIFQHSLAASVITAVLANVQTVHAAAGNIDEVAVIAHSVSTSIKAREIRTQAGWYEVPPKRADFVLVVCRSMLFNPLSSSYRSYGELDEDAENQLNISGSNFHLYVYAINDDLSVTQVQHESFEAED